LRSRRRLQDRQPAARGQGQQRQDRRARAPATAPLPLQRHHVDARAARDAGHRSRFLVRAATAPRPPRSPLPDPLSRSARAGTTT
jgi:hypothetical protein